MKAKPQSKLRSMITSGGVIMKAERLHLEFLHFLSEFLPRRGGNMTAQGNALGTKVNKENKP